MANKRFLNLEESVNTALKNDTRFVFINDEKDIDDKIKGRIPRNTSKNTNWTLRIWDEWANARNALQTNKDFPKIPTSEKIATIENGQLDLFLSRFVFEIRRRDGNPYPPATLYNIVTGIQRQIRECGKSTCNLLEKSDGTFHKFRCALDARMKELTAQGIGTVTKQAETISEGQEKSLWDKGIFNLNTAKGLSYAVFYYTCKVFGLRSGDEHRNLRKEQFQFSENENGRYVQFNGGASKTKSGGLRTFNRSFKKVVQFEDQLNARSYYNIIRKYLSLVPEKAEAFYFKPATFTGNQLLFTCQVIGKSVLDTYVSNMMKECRYTGYFTNHSVKATLATDMYEKGYDEQLIQERTGHSSTAVRRYKRTSDTQHKKISKELDPPLPPPSSFTLTEAEHEDLKDIKELLNTSEDFFNYDFASQRTPTKKQKLDLEEKSNNAYNLRSAPKKDNIEDISKRVNNFRSTSKKEITSPTKRKMCRTSDGNVSGKVNRLVCDLRKTPVKDHTPVKSNSKSTNSSGSSNSGEDTATNVTEVSSMVTYTHKKYDLTSTQNVSVFKDGKRITLCDQCGSEVSGQQASFDINLADFLPSDCTIQPKDINIKGLKTRRGGQLIVKIDY